MKKPVTLSLDENLIAAIDAERGQQSRSSYVEAELLRQVPEATHDAVSASGEHFTIVAAYRCKDNRCDRTFGSENAKCPVHGCKAVPV